MPVTVLVDAENVRRSVWPNLSPEELLRLCGAWAREHGHRVVVVFDGPARGEADGVEAVGSGRESADDWIARAVREGPGPYWVVTSDRGLRSRLDGRAERTIGGGAFARELLALRSGSGRDGG